MTSSSPKLEIRQKLSLKPKEESAIRQLRVPKSKFGYKFLEAENVFLDF